MTQARFTNLPEFRRRLNPERLLGPPLRKALLRSGEYAKGQAQERTPVDRGRARNSYKVEIDKARIPQFVKIGSNLSYIRPLEEGSRPHWPPLAAMQPWARRHGFPAGRAGAFLVARAIARRGTRAHWMLRDGIRATKGFFRGQLREAAREIEGRFRRG